MGSGFASVKVKRLTSDGETGIDDNGSQNKQKKNIRTLSPPYPVYLISRLLLVFLWSMKILSINFKTSVKVIHAQDTGYSGLAAIISGKILRIPVVISSHGVRHKSIESSLTGILKKILLKWEYNLDIFTLKNAYSIIALNPGIKDYYENLVGKDIDFIPNPIQTAKYEFSTTNRGLFREELQLDDKTRLVGYVGRLSPEKNLNTLLTGFADAAREDSSLKLVLVGSGPEELQLKELVNKLHIQEKVIFCGLRYDIPIVLCGMDIFVLASFTEGLSGALLEAMSCQRAIICSNIAANRELISDNIEGLVVNPNNAGEISGAILQFARDDNLRSRLGNNAKIKASQYDQEIVFPKVLHLYERLIQKRAIKSQ
jgi:glycosyltransferase involved in cell wall biosynthesis